MRTLIIAASVTLAACSGGSGAADSSAAATPADSAIVAGPPAVPATLTPPPDSSSPATAARTTGTRAPQRPATPPPATTTTPAPTTRADTVVGTVSVVGTSFDKRVMIVERGTQRRVEITGQLSAQVGHVAGAEVSVIGTATGTQLDAARFTVTAVDNLPAIDGRLSTEAGTVYIVTENGRRTRIAAPPPEFVGRDGARVWITGDPAKGVQSYGFIDPPR